MATAAMVTAAGTIVAGMAIAAGTEAAIGTARAGAPAIMAMAGVTRIAGPSGAGTIGYASAVDLAGNHPRAAAGVAALLSLNSPLILQIVCHGRACPTRMPGPVPMAGMMARNAIVSAPHLGSGLRRGGRKEARRLSSMTRAIGKILDKLDSFRQNKKRTSTGVAHIMERIELDSPECVNGCAPCYLDCALCRVTMLALSREIERLLRAQPPLAHPGWPDWQTALLAARDHMTALRLRLAAIDPSAFPGALAEAGRRGSARVSLH